MAVVVHLGTGISLGSGLLVGAMVCATDPASIVATFRGVEAPARLRTLVEGESLLNDGTSLVVFVVALRIVTGGLGAADAAVFFVTTLTASVAIGGVLGFVCVQVLRTLDDHVLEATITIACAYGAAVIADGLGESGIVATAVAGLVVGTYGRRVALSVATQQALDEVWEVAAFILAAFIFMIVGAAIPLPRLVADAGPVAWGVLAVVLARLLAVYGLLGAGERVLARLGRGRAATARDAVAAMTARWRPLTAPGGPERGAPRLAARACLRRPSGLGHRRPRPRPAGHAARSRGDPDADLRDRRRHAAGLRSPGRAVRRLGARSRSGWAAVSVRGASVRGASVRGATVGAS